MKPPCSCHVSGVNTALAHVVCFRRYSFSFPLDTVEILTPHSNASTASAIDAFLAAMSIYKKYGERARNVTGQPETRAQR